MLLMHSILYVVCQGSVVIQHPTRLINNIVASNMFDVVY